MNEEITRILKMVEEGKLNSEQGAMLIEALKDDNRDNTVETVYESISSEEGKPFDKEAFMKNDFKGAEGEKFLQIRILSGDGDRVKINLPINFVKGILKVTGKLPMIQTEQLEGVDVAEMMEVIMAAIENDLTGRLVDVESANGDLVIVEIA